MPDINFPSSPSGGDTYTFNNITFTYDGEKWTAKAPVTSTSTYGDANVAAYASSQGFIDLTDISVTSNSPSGNGSLSYNNGSGVFTFTPADASGSGGGSYADSDVDTHLNRSSASSGEVLTWNGSDYAWTAKTVDTDTDAQTLSLAGNVITISGSSSSVDLTTALGNVSGGSSYGDSNVATFLSTNNYSNTDIQPASISTDSTDGTALALEGGDATGLNSTGGNVDINSGTGALQSGYVNIGQSSQGVNIGANSSTAINVTGPLTVNNQLIIEDGVNEKFSSLTGATGVVTHDCDNGHIFYHTSISANFTANFTNLGLSSNYSTNLTLLLNQGVTAYIPSAVQIAGSAQTINWQGGSAPTGTANGIDAVSFTILRDSGSYIVLGQMVDFT
jgi:hypothetical protein